MASPLCNNLELFDNLKGEKKSLDLMSNAVQTILSVKNTLVYWCGAMETLWDKQEGISD